MGLIALLMGRTADARKDAKVHDYRDERRGWGHDFTYEPRNNGAQGSMSGWGYGIRRGDLVVRSHPDGGFSVYRFDSIRYCADPRDMWFAEVSWCGPEKTWSEAVRRITSDWFRRLEE